MCHHDPPVRHGDPRVRHGKTQRVVHNVIFRVAHVTRANVETRRALCGVAKAALGRAGLEGGKSRLKVPKFEKWLNGAPAHTREATGISGNPRT